MQKGHAARGVCLGRTSVVCIVDWGHMFACDRSRGAHPVLWLQAKRGLPSDMRAWIPCACSLRK